MAESLTIKINGDIKDFQKKLKGVEASTKELQTALSNIATKATIAFAGLGATITGLISTYRTQEQAEKKLETVLRSTGEAAGLTAQELKDMASGLQSVTTFGDEAIIEAQSLLLTFTKVGKDVFPQATESILNMSAALGTDLKSQALQVGKALNDPIAGVTALTRAGVSLTEQQKEQIKVFQESGDIAKAQSLILNELQVQFGGQAKAAAEGTGRFIQLSNTLGDMAEVIGKHLVPPLSSMAEKFNEILVDILGTKGDQFGKTAASILLVATNASILTAGLALATKGLIAARVAVKALGLSLKGLRATLISTGIGAIIIGISIAVEKFVMDFETNMKKAKEAWAVFSDLIAVSVPLIKKEFETTFVILEAFGRAIISIGDDVLNFFTNLGKGIVNFFKGPAQQALDEYPDAIKRAVENKNKGIEQSEKSLTEKLTEIAQDRIQRLKDIYNEDREQKIEADNEEYERKKAQKELEDQEEEARLTKAHQREATYHQTLKKTKIDHEKFIMSAQKREALNYKNSAIIKEKIDKERSKKQTGNLKSTLGTISTLQSSGNTTLFNIGRAGALAMAYIDGKAAVIKALASAPPPINYGLATAVGLAVAAQIGQILGASPPKMNDGGMIMGSPGIDQNLAMLSRGELVVPTKNFDEVVGAVGGNRDADIFGDPQTVNVAISFEGDEASQVLTARQIEDRALGISREEVA